MSHIPAMQKNAVRLFRERIFRVLFVRLTLILAAFWLFFWGIAILVGRVSHIVDWNVLLYGGLGIVIAPIAAFFVSKRQIPSNSQINAVLDNANAAGGLLMTALERDTSAWNLDAQVLNVPVPSCRFDRLLYISLFAAVFAAIGLFIPEQAITASGRSPFQIEDTVKRLSQQLDVLKDEEILTLDEIQVFKSDLDKIQAAAEGAGPDKTYNALDHLEDQIQKQSAEASAEAQKNLELLTKAELLAQEALSQLAQKLDDPMAAQEMLKELGEMFNRMLAESEDLTESLCESPALSDEIKEMLKNGDLQNLTPEQLQELAEAMQNCQAQNARMLENMCENNLIDAETLEFLKEMKEIAEKDLKRTLKEMGNCWGNNPDEISEPSGDYADRETDENDTKYKSERLPPASLNALSQLQTMGESKGRPEENTEKEQGGGAIRSQEGGSGSAHSQKALPQHRGVIGRYFDRK